MSTSFIDNRYTEDDSIVPKSISLSGAWASGDIVKPLQVDAAGKLEVSGGSSGQDTFGNLRVVEPRTLFETKHIFGKRPEVMIENVVGTATSTYITNLSSIRLRVSASGDKVTYRSKFYVPYEPGRTQRALLTGIIGTQDSNVVKRLGLFDDNDGYFFQQDSAGMSVIQRSYTTGSVVETKVLQTNWNLDKLDGSGESGYTIDFTKGHIFIVEYAWLGYGLLRFGIEAEGQIIYCHEITHHNALSTGPYSRRGTLPVNYEIVATGTPSADTDLIATCACVFSEGGFSPLGFAGTAYNASSRNISGIGSSLPLISVRLKSTYAGSLIIPTGGSAISADAKTNRIELVVGGTLTSPSWSSLTNATEFDVAATAITGGRSIYSSFASEGISGELRVDFANLPGVDFSGNNDAVTLLVTRLSASNSDYYGNLNFVEVV